MPKITDFAPSLRTLLWTVFVQGKSIKAFPGPDGSDAIDTIYDIYAGSGPPTGYNRGRDRDELVTFLSKLDELHSHSGKQVSVQGLKETVKLSDIAKYYARGPGKRVKLASPEFLWTTFYHFLSQKYNGPAIKKRIYIHAAPPVSINSVSIMTVLVGLLDKNGYQGFHAVKVAGPGERDRRDTIVAYLEHDAVVQKVLEQIKTIPGGYFAPGVPECLKVVRPGVGIADEPSDVQLVGDIVLEKGDDGKFENPDPQSFGMFLSKLAWWALEATKDLSTIDEFLEHFMTALQVAQINPMNPHLHSNRSSLEHLQQVGYMALSRRRQKTLVGHRT
jgi:HopA1 effector protein family